MLRTKMRFLVAGMMMAILPLVASAQTADRQALIQQLTQQAAKLQAQLDQLRQASSSPPSPLAQQLTGGSAEFLKLLQTKIAQPQSAASSPANVHVSPENQSDNEPPPATVSFDRNLSFGMRNDADVSNLQEFLTDQGFYNNTISGNFFILTRNAVKKFQEAHGVKPSGYFGPATRAVANALLQGTAAKATDTAAATRRGTAAALNLSRISPTLPQDRTTSPLITAVPPTQGDRSVFLPLSFSLNLAKDSYELDEYLDGTGRIVNPNPVPAAAKFNLELSYKDTLIKTVPLDFPCTPGVVSSCIPAGTTPINPADVLKTLIGLDRIPPNPDLIGSWKLVVSMIPVNSAIPPTRIELPFIVTAQSPVTITIDGDKSQGTFGLQGLELVPRPVSQKTKDLIAQLKPQLWRVFLSGDIVDALSYNPKRFTYDTSTGYYYLVCGMKHNCDPINPADHLPAILPWEDNYAVYRKYVTDVMHGIAEHKMPVDYLEWWNEPDRQERFGTDQQMFETFKVFHDTVRSINPNQKIEAPAATFLDQSFLLSFLDYAAANNLRLDALSWHEWDPSSIAKDVQMVKTWFAKNSRYCSPKCPEIHINEFNSIQHYFIPGYQAAYLANFENSNVDWGGTPACFAIGLPGRGNMNTCYSAYNGFFMEDNETPQALYWVRRAYAEMQNTPKLLVQSSSERTTVMASKSDIDKTLRVLVGRYSCGKNGKWCLSSGTFDSNEQKAPSLPVTLSIANYPYGGTSVQAHISRIPNESIPGPLLQPVDMGTMTLSVINSKITYTIPQYQDGDVYSIVLTPVQQAPIISQILPSSGPTGTKVTLTGTGFTSAENTINFGGIVNAVTGISSSDGNGTTLSFVIPSQLCNQLSGSAVCPPLKPGTYDVSVTNVNGTSNAVKFIVTGQPSPRGTLSIDPASATLKIGERIQVKAIFAPPRPACLDATPPCRVPERAPYEVEASFTSSDPSVASVDALLRECASPPPGITSPCSPQYFVRGITAGSATISASYASGEGTFTAKMNVTVAGQFSSQGILSIVPASANLAIGGQIGVQAYYQQPLPACLHNNPPCALGMMEPSPQPVFALFASDNPNVAAVDKIEDKTCDPPRMCPVSVSHYAVRGVSAGSAVITASFSSNAAETLTATIKVAVSATTTAGIR